jgi:15-cis-phytoene synthase
MVSASNEYATMTLRETDRDRYFATLLLDPGPREAIAALYAFNADIASVRDRARDPNAGEIRLQWWKDALEGEGHGAVRQNPLAAALLDAIAEYHLPVAALARLIAARRFDLYQDPMPDIATFEGYAGETVSVLYQLTAMILNGGQPVETGDAAGHLGVGHALVGHLRAFGYNAAQGRVFLPWDVFATCGVTENEVFAGEPSERLAVAVTRLTEMANAHLEQASTAIAALPKPLRVAFAPIAVLRLQLRRVNPESPFQPRPDIADWRKIAALSWWKLRNG